MVEFPKFFAGHLVEYERAGDRVYDAFGEQIRIRRIDDTWLEATAEVQISPTFFGWLMQFSSSIRIAAPDEIADEYRQWILSAVTCDEGCVSDE